MGERTVRPRSAGLDAVVEVPGSKSIANRAVVCAVLADGPSTIENVPDGDDSRLLVEGCRALGATIRWEGTTVTVDAGVDLRSSEPVTLDAGLGGTTSRFLTAVAALRAGPTTVTGGAGLQRRPMDALHQAIVALGASVEWAGVRGRLPATISHGPVRGGRVAVSAASSSQFASALVLAGPLMDDGLVLEIPVPRVSMGYLDMSVAVSRSFGADVRSQDGAVQVRHGGYRGRHYVVEPDASSASFVFAAAALLGGRVVVRGMAESVLQPEREFVDILGSMGCTVAREGADLSVSRDAGTVLRGVDVDLSEMSDAVPMFAALATRALGPSRIRGVGFIRGKESNRIEDLATELRKTGATIEVGSDGMVVVPQGTREAVIDPHDDHRIAMACAVLGLAGGPVSVRDPEVVAKSWPAFWDVLAGLV